MIDDDLAPDLRALFDAEKRRDDGPPLGAKDRVSHALGISLGIGIGAAATAAGSASASIGGAAASKGALAAGAAANASAVSATATTAAATTAGSAVTSVAAAKTAAAIGATTTAASVAAGTAATAATTAGVTATGGALAKGLAFALVTAMAGTTGTGIYLAARDEAPKAHVVDVRPSTDVPSTFDPSMLAKKTPPPVVEKPMRAPVEARPIALAPLTPANHALTTAPVSTPPATPEQKAERLKGERAVLDTARTAVSRGDGGAALIALEAHRDSYADGALVEEREALTVLALVKLGRTDDAKAKAAAFRANYPRSLFLGAMDGALR